MSALHRKLFTFMSDGHQVRMVSTFSFLNVGEGRGACHKALRSSPT